MYSLEIQSFSLSSTSIMPMKTKGYCVVSGRIYIVGGSMRRDSCSEAIVHAKEYVPYLDLWRPIANMLRKRYGCLGAVVDWIFYVIIGLMFGNKNGFSL